MLNKTVTVEEIRRQAKQIKESKKIPTESGSVEIIMQSTQKLKTDEPTSIKMPQEPDMPTSFRKKDADESLPVKVVEIKNKESLKISKKTKSTLSELNTLKDVPPSMPIVDVQHDKAKNDKFFASAELL